MSTDTETLIQGFSAMIALLLVVAALAGPTIALLVMMRNRKKDQQKQSSVDVEYRTKQMMLLEMTREDVAVIKETMQQQDAKLDKLGEKNLIVEIELDNQKKALWCKIDEIAKFVGMPVHKNEDR